ncbi:hypothetical protein ACROYT_G012668 [Oculina patagonica]
MKISGCIALVTGGASGIGRGICELLLQHGAKVAVVDVNDERGQEVERTFGEKYGSGCIKFIRCDVSVESDLKEAFSAVISLWGQIDIVCNNAAVVDEDNWNKTLNTNLGGVIHGTLLGLEQMKNGSVIVNTSSTAGLSPWKLAPVYCATKHGIVAFTRSIANAAIRDKGIRVNCICPGRTDTEMDFPRHRLRKEEIEAQDSLPKQPVADVVKGVIELIEDDTKNGEVLVVCVTDGTKYKQFTN